MITSRRDGGRGMDIEVNVGVVGCGACFGVDCWMSLISKNRSPRSKNFYFALI